MSSTNSEVIKELEKFSEQYMKNHCSEAYKNVINAIYRFNNDKLSVKLYNFYLNKVRKECRYEKSKIGVFSFQFCRYLNEINHPDVEYYLEYCLEFFEEEFLLFLDIVYEISVETNFILKNICSDYSRYCNRIDKEILLEKFYKNIPSLMNEKLELKESLNAIIEIEKKHILNCYELAKDGKTFCENCIPMCWVLKKEDDLLKQKVYKRTTLFRK